MWVRAAALVVVAGLVVVVFQQAAVGKDRPQPPDVALGRREAGTRGRSAVAVEVPAEMGLRRGAAAADSLRGDLGRKVRERGGDPAQYASALRADASLWIDREGQMLYLDAVAYEVTDPVDPPPLDPTGETGPPPPPQRLLASGLPIHHSKPGATFTMFIDFDGAIVRPNPNSIVRQVSTLQGLTLDADPRTFTQEEQAIVSRTWGRVAEDLAPFDVDVTTEEPAVIDARVLWSIVGRAPAEIGLPPQVGGASPFCLCYVPFSFLNPTFTFWSVWGARNHSSLADTITHEAGHMFGLTHDGQRQQDGRLVEYYEGHGSGATSWGPVMGSPLNRNVTQWSRGDYPAAENFVGGGFGSVPLQDDLAIIAGRLGRRADDFGDSLATSLPLAVPATGYITEPTDVDLFVLPRASDVHVEVTPFRAGELTDGGNLDVAIDILDSSGRVVATADDPEQTAAALTAILSPEQHYLRVRPSFNPANYPAYASLGQYTVTGTFANLVRILGFEEPDRDDRMTPGRTVPVRFALTDSVAAARVQLWSAASPPGARVLAEAACRARHGLRQQCELRLPRDLMAGATYWIAAQYLDGGAWITAQPKPGSKATNPLSIVAAAPHCERGEHGEQGHHGP